MDPRAALLLGATGLIGRACLARLLDDPLYAQVTVLARRPTGVAHDRLREVVADLANPGERAREVWGDDVYCCLGTTIKTAGSQEAFRRIDHDLVLDVLRLARSNGARRVALVSSVGADPSSGNFYLRVKGETERDVGGLGFEQVEVMRPSLLLGDREERRTGEAIGRALLPSVSWMMVGGLRAYRPIEGDTVAAAMLAALRRAEPGLHVRTHDELVALARGR